MRSGASPDFSKSSQDQSEPKSYLLFSLTVWFSYPRPTAAWGEAGEDQEGVLVASLGDRPSSAGQGVAGKRAGSAVAPSWGAASAGGGQTIPVPVPVHLPSFWQSHAPVRARSATASGRVSRPAQTTHWPRSTSPGDPTIPDPHHSRRTREAVPRLLRQRCEPVDQRGRQLTIQTRGSATNKERRFNHGGWS